MQILRNGSFLRKAPHLPAKPSYELWEYLT